MPGKSDPESKVREIRRKFSAAKVGFRNWVPVRIDHDGVSRLLMGRMARQWEGDAY
jgi:hypothetical protein